MCLFTISKRKMIIGKKSLERVRWRGGALIYLCPPHYSRNNISWASASLVPGTGDAGPQRWGEWLRLGSCVWGASAWWLEHGCHSVYGDHCRYWFLRNGTAAKCSSAKVCLSSILPLASLCPVPAHWSQYSACSRRFWRLAAQRVN